jgi:hypothetical protein
VLTLAKERSADHAKDDWINGEKTEDVVSFLDRLFTARRKVEERIVALGGVEESTVSPCLRHLLDISDR